MSALKTLVQNSASYFVGRMAVLLAGLIALPVTTRLLPREDYGLMSLIFLLITMITALSTFGFPQATTRYFSEHATRGVQSLLRFCTSMMAGAAVTGTATMLLVYLASLLLLKTPSFAEMAVHLKYAVILILIRQCSSVCLQIFRGNQQTLAYNLFNIANRYLSIALIIVLILGVYGDVTAVFVGTIAVEATILLVTLPYLFRKQLLGWVRPDSIEVRRAIKFGTPLVFADLMVSLVASSDRFAIQYFLGPDSVAIYSVAYDVADYAAIMFASPLQLAILPIVYSLWAKEGRQATEAFLNKSVNLSLVIIAPMIVGIAIVGPDIVTILASDKYAESGELLPTVALGVILGSIQFLLFAGLLVREKTRVVTLLNGSAAVLNLVLNLLLIPKFGVIGAAYATVSTYAALNTVTYFASSRYLKITIEWLLIFKALGTAAVMGLAVWYLNDLSGYVIVDTLIRSAIGALIYVTVMYFLDLQVRQLLNSVIERIVPRSKPRQ